MITTGMRHTAAATFTTAIATLAIAAPSDAAPTVSSTYAQNGSRTLWVNVSVAGARKNSLVQLETKRFSRTRAGKARRKRTKLGKYGRATIKLAAPKGSGRITARLRILEPRKTKRKKAKKTTYKASYVGRWRTVTFSTKSKAATISAVRIQDIGALTPPATGQPGTIALSGASADINVGNVIALGITSKTPDGLFVRATAVAPSPGGATVAIEPAYISDVVPAGELEVDIPTEVVARAAAKQLAPATPRALECTAGRTATATVSAELSAGVSLGAKWSGGGFLPPKAPSLAATLTAKTEARVEGEIKLDGQATCTLAPQTLFPAPVRLAVFTVQVGPVPVPVVVDGQVTLTGEAKANGSLTTSAKAWAGAEAKVLYSGGKFTPSHKFERQFTFQPPTVNGTGSAEIKVAPQIGVKLAGAAGTVVDLTAGIKLAGNLNPSAGEPWWKLTSPMSLGATFRFDFWRLHAGSERYELWSEEPVIAQADVASRPGSKIVDEGIAPQPLPEGVKTRLTWDSDTDVDLHTWNQYGDHAYFGDLEAISGGYLDRDIIPGYGPETFRETNRNSGNQYTFGVCQYRGTNANVTVDVRDTDGTTRRFTVTLLGNKAAALLTTSPKGITPYIDADTAWCNKDADTDPTALGQTSTGTFD